MIASVSPGAAFPADFRGLVMSVSDDGKSVSGAIDGDKTRGWSWPPEAGFETSTAKSSPPETSGDRLEAWTKAHGWLDARAQKLLLAGKPITSYGVYATALSSNGNVVVGEYSTDDKQGRHGAYSSSIGSLRGSFCPRNFIWTKKDGFKDLWDLAGRVRQIGPTEEIVYLSAALSPNGRTIASRAGKLYIIRLK